MAKEIIRLGTGYDPTLTHRWAFVYLDGKLEELMGNDVFMANAPRPGIGDTRCIYETDTGLCYEVIATIFPEAPGTGVVRFAADEDGTDGTE